MDAGSVSSRSIQRRAVRIGVFILSFGLPLIPIYGSESSLPEALKLLEETSGEIHALRILRRAPITADIGLAQLKAGDREGGIENLHRAADLLLRDSQAFTEGDKAVISRVTGLLEITEKLKATGMLNEREIIFDQVEARVIKVRDTQAKSDCLQAIAIFRAKSSEVIQANRVIDRLIGDDGTQFSADLGTSPELTIHKIVSVVEAFLAARDRIAAQELLARMGIWIQNITLKANRILILRTYWQQVAIMQAKLGNRVMVDDAYNHLVDYSNREPVVLTESTAKIAGAFAQANNPDAAREYVQRAVDLIAQIATPSDLDKAILDYVWLNIASTKANSGDLEGAMEAQGRIANPSLKRPPHIYKIGIDLRAEDYNSALLTIQHSTPIERGSLLRVVEGLSRRGELQEARRAFEILEASWNPPKGKQSEKEYRRNLEALPELPAALRALGSALGMQGALQEAIEWARKRDTSYTRAYAMLGVAEGLICREHTC